MKSICDNARCFTKIVAIVACVENSGVDININMKMCGNTILEGIFTAIFHNILFENGAISRH